MCNKLAVQSFKDVYLPVRKHLKKLCHWLHYGKRRMQLFGGRPIAGHLDLCCIDLSLQLHSSAILEWLKLIPQLQFLVKLHYFEAAVYHWDVKIMTSLPASSTNTLWPFVISFDLWRNTRVWLQYTHVIH